MLFKLVAFLLFSFLGNNFSLVVILIFINNQRISSCDTYFRIHVLEFLIGFFFSAASL